MKILQNLYRTTLNKSIWCQIKNFKYSSSTTPTTTVKPKTCNGGNNPLLNEMLQYGQPTYWTHPHLFDVGFEQVTPGISKQEYEFRRSTYVKYLTNYQNYFFNNVKSDFNYSGNQNFIAIIPSNLQAFMAPDVPYTFKQNSDFLYLTGFKEPNSVLVLSKTDSTVAQFKATLFVRDKDPRKEMWDGANSGSDVISKLCGIEQAYGLSEFETFLKSLLKEVNNKQITLWRYPTEEIMQEPANPNCFNEVIENQITKFHEDNKEKVILMNEIDSESAVLNTSRYFVQLCRVKKSKSEIEIMRRSCDIAAEAFINTIYASHPHANEHLLYAKFDYETRLRGADHLAYIPVVAGGPRATVLHYIRNDQLIMNNRLVLMDAGCQYRDYASDITRSWPVNGQYNNAQRDVYQACLNVQQYCIEQSQPGVTINTLYSKMMKKIGAELIQLGILSVNDVDITNEKLSFPEQQKISKFCSHDVGHYLGMDVHDCPEISKTLELEPGAVITIEPGIYIKPDEQSVPNRYRGIGIRIEDDIVITENGCDVLSKKCPKTIEEIENLIKNKT